LALQCYPSVSSWPKKILSGGGQTICVGGVRRQQGAQNASPLGADLITMRLLYLDDEPVRTQQTQLTRHHGRLPASHRLVGRGAKQRHAQVAVTEAFHQEVATGNRPQQLTVAARQRIERPRPLTVLEHGLPQRFQEFAQRRRVGAAGQTLRQTLVGPLADLGLTRQVRHALTQTLPRARAVGVAFLGPVDFERTGLVNGRLQTQTLAELVVGFQGVDVLPELDAQSLAPRAVVGLDLAGATIEALVRDASSQEAQEVTAAEHLDGVTGEAR
jgi:hypothetical protein